MELNALERALSAVMPAWGARRLADKLTLAQLRSIAADQARTFDAARRDRRTAGWQATGGAPNAELTPALSLIIRRSRDLVRNNEWAKQIRRKWVANAIGSGIVPRPDLPKGNAKDIASGAWNAFAESCDPEGLTDFYGLQALAMGEVVEGGACFVRWYLRPSSWGLKVPLQCEVLPHEFLDTRRFQMNGGNIVMHGVEYDQDGRRVAYWLYRQHPGEMLPLMRNNLISDRVPASEVDHVFFRELAGQITGIPWLAVTALRLRDIADRDEAALLREKIAACLSVIVRRQGGPGKTLGQQAAGKNGGENPVEKIRPGSFAYVESDGDITVVDPPNAGDVDFVNRNLYPVAAGAGLPHMMVSGDLSRANYSSMRAGDVDFRPVLGQIQWNMAVPMMCRPAWRRVMAAAQGRGLQVSTDTAAKWAMPARPWVNPVDDMKATAARIALGLTSPREEAQAQGFDFDELMPEIKEDLLKLAEAGLSPTTAAGIAGDRLQPAPAADGQTDGSEPAKQE